MRIKLVIRLAGAMALATASLQASGVQVSSATPPALVAKRAEAQRVISEISAIDERLNVISEQYDGARVRLDALRTNLKAERRSLAEARQRFHVAQGRAAKLLVWLYTSSHSSAMDVILGADSLTQMINLSDAEDAIGRQAKAIEVETKGAKQLLEQRVKALELDRASAAATVKELAQRRGEIMKGLAERRSLLAKVQSQVNVLEAKERARQARLAAIARKRLAEELAARARAEAAARARAAAQAAAAERARVAAAAEAKAKAEAVARAHAASTPSATALESPAGPAATSTTTATTTTSTTTTTATATTTTSTSTTTATTPATTPAATVETTTQAAVLPATTISTQPDESTVAASIPSAPVDVSGGHPEAATIALRYLGVPYAWGGSSPGGFDCSGLVTYVYAQLGIDLPHFAAAQWTYGTPVAQDQLQPGDLVFFDSLNHVGIYIGNGQFVAAPHTGSFVKIDSLSEGWYADKYVGARRI